MIFFMHASIHSTGKINQFSALLFVIINAIYYN